jgi:hypothetical protein
VPPAPDAITGPVPTLPLGQTGYGPNLTPEQHYAQTVQQFAAHPQDIPDQAERDRAAMEMSINNPVAFELYKQHLAQRKVADVAAAQLAASENNLANLKQDVADRQKADAITQVKADAIYADAMKLANTPMDRGRWFHNKSLMGQIATVGVALLGGLLQGANGGRNTGMDWITGSIDKDIDDQKTDIENKRAGLGIRQGAVAQEFARTGNLYQAAETVRLASYQVALDHLATMQQDYDPRGTSFAEIGSSMQQMAARQAQAREVQRKELHTETLADIKEERERAVALATIQHQRNEDSIAAQRLGIERSKAKADAQVWEPAQLAAINTPPGGVPPPVPPIKMSQADYTKWLETGQHIEGLRTAQRANDPNEIARKQSVPGIVNNKGELIKFREDVQPAIATAKANVSDVVRMTDELLSMMEEHGYSSDYAKSPEWQRAMQTYASIILKAKEDDHLGAMSGSDYDIEAKKVGTNDPTQIRNTIAGIKSFRHQLVEGFNSQVANKAVLPKGESVARWEPANLVQPKSEPSPEQQSIEVLKAKPTVSVADARAQELNFQATEHHVPRGPDGTILWGQAPPDVAYSATAAATAAAAETKDISPLQRHGLEALRTKALAGDASAIETLTSLTSKDPANAAHSAAVRKIAKDVLAEIADHARIQAISGPPGAVSPDIPAPRFDLPVQPTFPGPK